VSLLGWHALSCFAGVGLSDGIVVAQTDQVDVVLNKTVNDAMPNVGDVITVAAPAAVPDPDPASNSATDTDTISAQADLSITKTDGVSTAYGRWVGGVHDHDDDHRAIHHDDHRAVDLDDNRVDHHDAAPSRVTIVQQVNEPAALPETR
jgi:hypothetical protein